MKRISKADQVVLDQINKRLGLVPSPLTAPERIAIVKLGLFYDYEIAAEEANTDVETVREWARDPVFIDQLGRFMIGLAEVGLEG